MACPRRARPGCAAARWNATIFVPPNTGQAIELLAAAMHTGKVPPERVLTTPVSVPALDSLRPKR